VRSAKGWLARGALAALPAALLAAGAAAGEVRWAAPEPLAAGQIGRLELVFEDCDPEGPVTLPRVAGLSVLGEPGESRQFSIENFRSSSSVTLSYPVRPEREGRLSLPAFEVATSRGPLAVPALELRVGRARLPGPGGAALEDVVRAELRPEEVRPYAGQVFPLDLLVSVRGGRRAQVGDPVWAPAGLATEGFGEGQVQTSGGVRYVRFATRAQAAAAGRLALPPVRLQVGVETGRRTLGFFFNQPELTQVWIESDAPELEVRPLPEPRPAGFGGAVGSFSLESSVVPESVAVGEPVTWTLRLSGTGNWPVGVALPARAVPVELRTIQPRTRREFAEGSLYSGALSEDLVMIPTRPGALELAPVRFVYFDPVAEGYRSLLAQPPRIAVTPAALAPAPPELAPPAPPVPAQPAPAAQPEIPEPPAPLLPGADEEARLPRGPLPGSASAPTPVAAPLLARGLALPALALGLFWLALAGARARKSDPGRPRREAHRALGAAIEAAREAPDRAARAAALLDWQLASAAALEARGRAPSAASLAAAAASQSFARAGEWERLWAEGDAVVYGRGELPPDWCARAGELWRGLRAPRFNPLRALAPRNLLALGLAAALLGPLPGPAGGADAPGEPAPATPLEAYQGADFAAAARGFRARAASHPDDWVARANLGLASAQLGEVGEALAHTAAAFLRAPRRADLRFNLALFAGRAGPVEPVLARLARAEGAAALARWAAPAEWQAALLAGALLGCAAAGLGLWRRFRGGGPPAGLARAAAATGALLALAAVVALRTYGPLADPAAALLVREARLRSVPTDAEAPQAERPLAAGALVVVRGQFLGWRRVHRANGEEGWLREAALIPLYAPPASGSGSGRILPPGGPPMAIPGFAPLDFRAYHRETLPGLLARGRGAMAARAAREHGSLAFRLESGDAWTYRPGPGGIEIAPGDAAADTVMELRHDAWEGLVHDYESAPGLLYSGRVRTARGDAMRFVGWEPALRALYTGRPVYDPAALDLRGRDGRPLDLERAFTLADEREDMAHFLRSAGYCFVRGVFGADEVAGFLADALALRGEARKGDKLSWWATSADGEEICSRVTRGADKEHLVTLPRDARILGLAALADTPLVQREGEGNGVTCIYKSPAMGEGLSDLPWHRDCGMGGHSVMCPVLIASVFLTPATPETGELRFLPGSWSRACPFAEATDARAPRGRAFRAEPGDVSIHYGDVMHAAPPPTRSGLPRYRISATVGFSRPDARIHIGGQSYNQVLHQREDGQIEHLAKVAGRA